MTDTPNDHRVKALELAVQANGTPADTVARAHAYHGFLAGTAGAGAATNAGATPPKTTAGATAGATPPKTPAGAATNKPGAAGAATKPGAAGATNKPAAGAAKPGAAGAANKPAAGAANKPAAAGAKPAAAGKPAAGAAASAGAIPGDTKAPDGVHTFAEVVAKLREVSGDGGENRPAAFKILAENGGAKSVRDLKPAHYDTVFAQAEALLAGGGDAAGDDNDPLGDPPEQTAGGLAADMDPTAQAPRDDMGL